MSTFSFHPFLSQNSKFKNQNLLAFTQPTFIIILILLSFVVLIQHAQGASVTLAWDPNSPVENVIGYRLYYGTESRNYDFMIDLTEETIKKIHNLEKGQNYYFAVTALNEAGQESDFSEEISVNTCTYRIIRKKRVLNAVGGVKKVRVRTQASCDWNAQSDASWLRIVEGDDTNTGHGNITYSVDPNPDPEKRVAALIIGGKRFKVIQRGSTLEE